jgi:hypothetical protein
MRFGNSKFGFAIVEVILAMGLFAIVVGGGVGVAVKAFSVNRLGEEESYAHFLANEGIEAARAIAARNYYDVANGSYGLGDATGRWEFSGSSDNFGSKFTRTVIVSDVLRDADGDIVESGGSVDLFTKRVTVKVEWDFSPARPNDISLTTYLTHWEESICDWGGASVIETLNLSGSSDATSIVVDGDYAYVGKKSNSSGPEFFALGIADPTNISVIGTGSLNLYGINGLVKKGNYVYAATRDLIEEFNIATEVTIFNVANPASPVRTFASIPGTHEANGVAIAGNYLYVVTQNSSSYGEFFVMNLSNPSNPTYLGDVEIGAHVYGITVRGTRAFLATAIANKELIVFNVSDPANPVEIGSYDVPLAGANGQSADYTGSTIHLVTRDNAGGIPEYHLLNSTNPAAITLIGAYDVSSRTNWVDASTGFSLLATEKTNEEFMVISTSNPSAPAKIFSQDLNGVAFSVGRKECNAFVVGANDSQEVTVVSGE